jgi:hypothetical protein
VAEQNHWEWVDDPAFHIRVMKYLEGDLRTVDLKQLSSELTADHGKRVVFVKMCSVCTALVREGTAVRNLYRLEPPDRETETPTRNRPQSPPRCPPSQPVGRDDLGVGRQKRSAAAPTPQDVSVNPELLSDGMILPAIRDDAPRVPPDAAAKQPVVASTATTPATGAGRSGRSRFKVGSVAALLVATLGLWLALRPGAPAAIVSAVAAATVDTGEAVRVKTHLSKGETLSLKEGAIELTFASGAVVVVRAPAQFQIVGGNGLRLDAGSLCAHVPPPARGFRVAAPRMTVVDLGTNFGVRAGVGASEVHVFDGTVEATAVDANGAGARPVRLSASQAVRTGGGSDGGLRSTPFAAAGFDRSIGDVRVAVPVHGTGVGIEDGSEDPHWHLLRAPGDPAWLGRPAIVLRGPLLECASNTPDARWVSLSATKDYNVPVGDYVYRTTVDLTGFDPATVSVRARAAADDMVSDVIVNGTRTGAATPHGDRLESILQTHELKIDGSWHDGVNQVDVVVANLPFDPKNTDEQNPMSFQFGWTMTAAPLVQR